VAKRLAPAAIVALKEALCQVYWYKGDLRSFLQSCIADRSVVAGLNWENYKRQIVSDLVDRLCEDQDRHIGDLTRVCHEVAQMRDFRHLEQLEGGTEKARRASIAVAYLRDIVDSHEESTREEADIGRRQKEAAEKLRANRAVRDKLEDIKRRYNALVVSTDLQARGIELERLMYDIFELFDLDPTFRNLGEQIDGAFYLHGTDYLFEAKWQQQPIGVQDLDAFGGKVRRKLENTLGLFLSINGFSPDGVGADSAAQPSVILMDGADLMGVLEERIDFVTLLLRKKRHAAQTGRLFLPIHEIV